MAGTHEGRVIIFPQLTEQNPRNRVAIVRSGTITEPIVRLPPLNSERRKYRSTISPITVQNAVTKIALTTSPGRCQLLIMVAIPVRQVANDPNTATAGRSERGAAKKIAAPAAAAKVVCPLGAEFSTAS